MAIVRTFNHRQPRKFGASPGADAAEINHLLSRESINLFDTFRLQLDTENVGTSNDNQFTLPLRSGETYNFIATIDGVDQPAHITDVSPTYTFTNAGLNVIEIRGADVDETLGFPGLHFNNGGDRLKVLNLESWGVMIWTNFSGAFFGCSNMVISSDDVVPVGTATLFNSAFQDINSFVVDDKWSFSLATTMFNFCRGSGITGFNPSGNLNSVLTMEACFRSCTSIVSIASFGLPVCTNISSMCRGTSNLTSIANFTDLSAVTNGARAFQDCTSLTEVPALNLVSPDRKGSVN